MIKGIGKDAEVVTNSNGGKQSKAIGALHLVDPDFLYGFFNNEYIKANVVTAYMEGNISKDDMVNHLIYEADNPTEILLHISKVLQEGAEKYSPNNWRLIPEEEHLNHALCHLLALDKGDEQDDHLGHFYCRIMMAYATKKTEGFDYIKPMEVKDE